MTRPGWFIDETAHAGDEHLDPAYVPGYDHKSATDPTEDLEILHKHGLNEMSTLVDLGAGTGTFSLAVAPFCRSVIAVDVSPHMLAQLEQKRKAEGIVNIQGVQAGFLSYVHVGDLADFVYSRHALHHLPDFWKVVALERIAGILKPGGVLFLRDLVYSFDPAEIERTIEAWLAGASKNAELGWTQDELETHVREEHSTFSWLLEPMLQRCGFKIEVAEHRGSIYSAYTCIKTPICPA